MLTNASFETVRDIYKRYLKLTAEERQFLHQHIQMSEPEPAPARGRPPRKRNAPLADQPLLDAGGQP